jgi:hypothetical protein
MNLQCGCHRDGSKAIEDAPACAAPDQCGSMQLPENECMFSPASCSTHQNSDHWQSRDRRTLHEFQFTE